MPYAKKEDKATQMRGYRKRQKAKQKETEAKLNEIQTLFNIKPEFEVI